MNEFVKRTSNQPQWSYEHNPDDALEAIWNSSVEIDTDAIKQWCLEAEKKYDYKAPDIDYIMDYGNKIEFANIEIIYRRLSQNRKGNRIRAGKDNRWKDFDQTFPEFDQISNDYKCWGKMYEAIINSKDFEILRAKKKKFGGMAIKGVKENPPIY